MAYKTQFSDQEAGKGIFPARDEIRSRIEAMARFYGLLGGVTYAEPFLQKEVGLVDDLTRFRSSRFSTCGFSKKTGNLKTQFSVQSSRFSVIFSQLLLRRPG